MLMLIWFNYIKNYINIESMHTKLRDLILLRFPILYGRKAFQCWIMDWINVKWIISKNAELALKRFQTLKGMYQHWLKNERN